MIQSLLGRNRVANGRCWSVLFFRSYRDPANIVEMGTSQSAAPTDTHTAHIVRTRNNSVVKSHGERRSGLLGHNPALLDCQVLSSRMDGN